MKHPRRPLRLLWRLVRLSAARPVTVLSLAALAFVLALLPLRQLRIDSDMLALLPKHSEEAVRFRETLTSFGTTDLLLAGLELGERGLADENVEYAELFVEALRESPLIEQVTFRAADFREDAEQLVDRLTLFLEPAELEELRARFTPAGAERAAQRIAATLAHPLENHLRELVVKDPMDVLSLVAKRPAVKAMASGFGTRGYLVDPQERLLLISIRPKGAAADLPFSRKLMVELDELRARTDTAWREENEGEPPAVIFGGGYPIAAAEGDLVVKDMTGGMVFSLVSVVLLFTFAFGRARALLISGLPLVLGLVLTFAFLALTLGRLNAATSAFAALLIGLAVDFIIVLYSRYLESRGRGFGHARALASFCRGTSRGVILGAVTTAATFLAFLYSSFPALSELGLITGVGILILMLTVFAMLPALLTLLERNRRVAPNLPRALGLENLVVLSGRHPHAVLIGAMALTVALAVFVPRVRYDDDVRNMRSPQNPGVIAQNRMMAAFDMRLTPILVRIDAADEDSLLAKVDALASALEPLVDGQRLAKLDAPLRWLPRLQRQSENLAALRANPLDVDRFRADFERALTANGLQAEAFMANLDPLLRAMRLEQPQLPSQLAPGALASLLQRYLVKTPEGCRGLVYCYTPRDQWHNQLPPGLREAVATVPGASLTGPVVISMALKQTVWHDARLAMALGSFVVLLLMIWDLRSLRAALFAAMPLGLGMLWMLGAMGLAKIPINFTNIFVFSMMIGIGVDYGIHYVHNRLEAAPQRGVAKAILIAAATTLLGFGSLSTSHYPGLRSLGLIAILGTLSSALVSLTVLPALLQVLGWPKGQTQASEQVEPGPGRHEALAQAARLR